MPVTPMLARIEAGICENLARRCGPEDEIEVATSVVITSVVMGNDDATQCRNVSAVNIYVSLKAPELGPTARVIGHVLIPARNLEEVEEVQEASDELWDALQGDRVMARLEREVEP